MSNAIKERWEVILSLYTYNPNKDRFICNVCSKVLKTDNGMYTHISENHHEDINKEL